MKDAGVGEGIQTPFQTSLEDLNSGPQGQMADVQKPPPPSLHFSPPSSVLIKNDSLQHTMKPGGFTQIRRPLDVPVN
jgi:hypothetical protein